MLSHVVTLFFLFFAFFHAIFSITMPDLTDEEYDTLDEYYTKNPPKLSGNGKSGFFAKRAEKGSTLIFVDDLSLPTADSLTLSPVRGTVLLNTQI
jgi:hypothetical protein